MAYTWSLSGIRFYQSEEGNVLHPYHGVKDLPGVMTIYCGHVIHPDDSIEPPYTQEKSDYWTNHDGKWAQAWLMRQCPWVTDGSTGRQHQFDACVSLVLNAGHVFSDLLEEINGQNRPDVVRKLWMSHTRAGNDDKALVYRRAKEVALYLTPDPPTFDEASAAEVLAQVDVLGRQIVADDGFTT